LRSWKKDNDGSYVIVQRSVVHADVPEFKDNVRANINVSGFLLTPYISQEDTGPISFTLLLWIAQLDREGILIFTPDLLGETDELFRSFHNLRTLLFDDRERREKEPALSRPRDDGKKSDGPKKPAEAKKEEAKKPIGEIKKSSIPPKPTPTPPIKKAPEVPPSAEPTEQASSAASARSKFEAKSSESPQVHRKTETGPSTTAKPTPPPRPSVTRPGRM
jgi:hypothetical protein